jgi:hypothetical protein
MKLNGPSASGQDQSAPARTPVGRRRALNLLASLAAAAAGAAILSAERPEPASADSVGNFSTTTTGIPAVSANSTVIDAAILASNTGSGNAVKGTGSSSVHPAVEGDNSGSAAGVSGFNSAAGVGVLGSTTSSTSAGVEGDNSGTYAGVYGNNFGGGVGVLGHTSSTTSAGVQGTNDGTYAGVYGLNTGTGAGVLGSASAAAAAIEGDNAGSGPGVAGTSTGGHGVKGMTSNSSAIGVYGVNTSGGTGGIGVWGVNTSSGQGLANAAVVGTNQGGGTALVGFTDGPGSIGLAGASNTGIGAYGSSRSYIGLFGYTETGYAVVGVANSKGGLAGEFVGPVLVTGSLTVQGAKSAAVKTKSGLKRLYCMESPESWFEDFGSGQLNQGKTTVSLEPGFAEIVRTDSYHVFLTPHDESEGLYVTQRNPSGFTVQEQHGGKSNVSFSYRIVAKRADIEGPRLESVTAPPQPVGPQEPALNYAPKPPSH